MRRVFVVLVLLAMMVGLQKLKADAPGPGDPLTLAAIGFVVLAAFAVAELGKTASLPKVTGYIVSGVIFGPYVVGVVSSDQVLEMEMFSGLAVGLIATTAGLELDLKALRSLAKTLGVTIALKLAVGCTLVGTTVIVAQMTFQVLPLDQSYSLALACVMAALSIGTSPAIALAIISENQAKGRLSDIVLGAAIAKDVVVVVAFALAIAVAGSLIGAGEGIAAGMKHTALHIAEEVGIGVLMGLVLILYLRFVKREMLLFVTAIVLVVWDVSNTLGLQHLLICIVAGIIVRNFSDLEHDLLHPLETVSLPVFIVFFTIAGAKVDLQTTISVLPLALAVCTARALGFWIASRIGGRVGGEEEPVQRLAWLGYLPQAGVALGLLQIAKNGLPELSDSIAALGMAVVTVNLLVGPITLRLALRGAGEIGGTKPATGQADSTDEEEEEDGVPWEHLSAPALRDVVKAQFEAGEAAMRAWVRTEIAPWVKARVDRLADPLGDRHERAAMLTAVREAIDRLPPDDAPDRVRAALDLYGRRVDELEAIQNEVTVSLETEHRKIQPGDSVAVGLRKRNAMLLDALRFRFSNRTRVVPARACARTVLEPRLATALEDAMRSWYRFEARQLEELRRCVLGISDAEETQESLEEIGQRFLDDVEADLLMAVARGARALARELAVVGSPAHPASRVRYSRVEPELVQWRERLVHEAEAWGGRRDAGARLVRITNDVALIERRIGDHLGDQVVAVAQEAFALLDEEIGAQQRRLAQVATHAREAEALDDATRERLAMEVNALVPRPILKRLRVLGGKLRRATSSGSLASVLREAQIEQVGRESIVHSLSALIDVPSPARGEVVTLDLGETIQAYIEAELSPRLEELLNEVWSAWSVARESMGACVSAAEFVLSSAPREGDEVPTTAQLATSLEHSGDTLPDVQKAAAAAWADLDKRISNAIGGIDEHLVEEIAFATGRSAQKPQARRRRQLPLLARGIALWKRLGEPALARLQALAGRFRGEAEQGIGRHYRLRAGVEKADAADIRAYLEDAEGSIDHGLRPVYRALFSTETVRDPRLFVAHRDTLQEIVRVERSWQQDSATGNGVLVVGASGTGKSSMVGIARLKLATRRVLVIPERAHVEEPTLLAYLARELGCTPEHDAITAALARTRVAIVVDDLHGWIGLGPNGVADLDALLSLLVATRGNAFWLVAVSTDWLEVVEKLIPVSAAFAQVIRLGALHSEVLGSVMDSRQLLSGLAVSYPVGWRARVLARLLRRPARDTYLGQLAAATRGNLRQAIRAWLRGAHEDGEAKQIVMSGLGVGWGLSFLHQCSAIQVGVLGLLMRGGPRRMDELSDALALPHEHVAREIRFLTAAGLVGENGQWLEVPVAVRDDVADALREFGAIPGGHG